MRPKAIIVAGALFAAQASQAQTQDCAPANTLHFLCGATKPEDLKRIPGTSFLVASGFSPGAGLKLVNTKAKHASFWYRGTADQIALNATLYPDCATPPDPALFNTRGLSLRRTGKRSAALHAVNHGGREAIEVFAIDWRGKAAPRLAWKGCLRMPDGHVGNAVATYGDGTVLVSVLTRPGSTITDFELGRKTGGIFTRAPGAAAFSLIPGSALPGNNGLETAADDSGFYTVAFGLRAVAIFKRGAEDGPEAILPTPGFMPDNIHRDGSKVLLAGMNSDEPACGGKRQIINGVADAMLCPRGWKVAQFDPVRRSFIVLAQGAATPAFNGVSQAVVMKRVLWLGSYQADRLAYVRLYARQ